MYAVLGATGKVGHEVVSILRAAGRPVRAIVHERSLDGLAGCEILACDIADPAALSRALEGADTVHVIVPNGRPGEDVPAKMRACIRSLTEALARVKPSRVLAISDYGAHRGGDIGLPTLFHEMEAQFTDLATDLVLLRSAEHMENWARLIRRVETACVLESMHHGIDKLFPTVSARDVGRIAAEILLEDWPQGRQIIHVEGPRRYAARDVAAVFSALLRKEISAVALDRRDWEPTLVAGGLAASTAREIAASFEACNAGLVDVDSQHAEVRSGRIELVDALSGAIERARAAGQSRAVRHAH